MKKAIVLLYIVVVAVMAAATIVERYQGTDYVSEHYYGAWWFSALWALLAAAGIFWFLKQWVRRPTKNETTLPIAITPPIAYLHTGLYYSFKLKFWSKMKS